LTPPNEEQIRVLQEAIAELKQQQEDIAARLALIERKLRIHRVAGAQMEIPAAPPPQPEPSVVETHAAVTAEAKSSLETRMGLTLINRLGVVTLVLGAGFFFAYAAQSGWINETARVLLGCAAGAAGLFFGDRIRRTGQATYANGITGAGVALLYLSTYAAFGLYHLVGEATAFVLLLAVTLAAGGLAIQYESQPVAMLGLFGGYLTPVILDIAGRHSWFLLAYVLALDAAALRAAQGRRWTALKALAFAGTMCLYGGQLLDTGSDRHRLSNTLFGALYYGIFTAMGAPRLFFAAQVLGFAALAAIWNSTVAPYTAFSLALAVAGVVVADRTGWPLAVIATAAGFWIALSIWLSSFHVSHEPALSFPLAAAGFLLFLASIPWRVIIRRTPTLPADLTALALNAAFSSGVLYFALRPHYGSWMGLVVVAWAVAHAGVAWMIRADDTRAHHFAAGCAWALLVLAVPIQFSGYRITIGWSLEAAMLAWIGVRFGQARAVQAALAMFALTLLRLAWFDMWIYRPGSSYAALVNLRFFTFAVAAAAFWAASRWIRSDWPSLATYLGGHLVMLWALSLETTGWAQRHTTTENMRSLESASLSILFGLYAVALVALGISSPSPVNRVLGLGLIGVVVAKLYLYDVWFLGPLYRMAAFAILGALLLAMSYLYSRFRASIEGWWRDRGGA